MIIKAVYTSVSPERRNPNLQLLTLPEAAALLLASLQKPQEGTSAVTSFRSGLRSFDSCRAPPQTHRNACSVEANVLPSIISPKNTKNTTLMRVGNGM